MLNPHIVRTAKLVGDSWVLLILYSLQSSPLRFNQLKEQLPAVTPRTLSCKLKLLVDAGILVKSCPNNNRNFCEYSIAQHGQSLAKATAKLLDTKKHL